MLLHAGYSCGLMEKTPRRINWHWRPVGADNKKIYRDLLGVPLTKIKEWYDKAWI
jgi:hypothetical protein